MIIGDLPHLRRRAHQIMGFAGLAAFIASGLLMHFCYRHLAGFDRATHLSFRSIHIYLLMASLVNVALIPWHADRRGVIDGHAPRRSWRLRTAEILASLGALLAAASVILLAAAFMREPLIDDLERPLTRYGVSCCAAGVLASLAGRSVRPSSR